MTAATKPGADRLTLDILNGVAPAVENLACNQEQCDQDGVMVKVSRQALDEVLNAVNEVALQAAMNAAPEGLATKPDGECPRCGAALGQRPIFLGRDGDGHVCGVCWQNDRIDEEYEAAGKRPVPSVSGNTDREQQRATTGVTGGESAASSLPGPSGPAGGETAGYCQEFIAEILAADAAPIEASIASIDELIAPAPVGEPVARQWKHYDPISGDPVWMPTRFWNGRSASESRPLYTAPPVTASVEEVARCIIGPRFPVHPTSKYSLDELRTARWDMSTAAERQDAIYAATAVLALLTRKEAK